MGGGKGSKNNTTKSTFQLPKEFIQAYNESLGLAREAIQQPYTPYTGQLVAGLTPTQQQGISNVNAAQGMALPAIQRGMSYTDEAARGITPELYQRFYSPYVRDVADTTFANLMESAAQQRSGLKGGAIQAGAFGGDRAGIAQGEMARQQQLANAQAMSNIYNQGYGQAMGLAGDQVKNLGAMGQQLAGLGVGAQSSALQGAQAQMAAGAQEQATGQAQLQAAYDQWLQRQAYPFQIAQYFANIAQGLGSTAGGTSSTTAPPPNTGSQILGGLGAIANIAGAIPFSDERLKENIEAVGQLNDGQTIYRYNFKGDPKTQIGLLAQEVEEVNPQAVGEVGGFKTVDYKGATEGAASSAGGVVAPGMDRQGFMNGGSPYGDNMGFVPQGMMSAGTSKIPGPAEAAQDAGLSGASDMTKPFTEQQNKGVANIASMFMTPSIYASGGVVGRHGFAEGGVPYMPYSGSRGFVPDGKMGGGGSSIPKAPDAFEDKGLAEDWKKINPISPEDADALVDAFGKVKTALGPKPDMAGLGYAYQPDDFEIESSKIDVGPMPDDYKFRFARGGVAGRRGYQFGGEPTMEDAMLQAEEQGLGATPQPPDDPQYARLLQKESGNNFGARNDQGYVGRAQFGEARLTDAKRAGVIPADMTPEDFRLNPEAQKAAESWHFNDINQFIDRTGLASMEGKSIGGVPVTREGMVNVAHLGGQDGLRKFISSGGRYNPADANGTKLSDYLSMGASGGVGGGDNIVPASADVSGVAGTPEPMSGEAERSKSPFSLKKLFASENNPSIVEQIIGRRLSPEARSAMLNASFALMAGKSPFFLSNVGEAGKVGTQTYYNALGMKRELQKQQADISRQGFEAQTGRMAAETAQLNAARQLYAQMLPQIRFWQMRNPGKSLPPEFQRVIDAAYPPQGPAGLVEAPGMAPALAGTAPAMAGADAAGAAPDASGAPVAPSGGQEAAGEPGPSPIPAPDAAEEGMTGGGNDLDALYSQLPNEMNPNYWTRMAENAMTAEDYGNASERAAELTKQYQENGIPLPSGVVPFPGTIERKREEQLTALQTEGAYKATTEQTERAQTAVASYQNSRNTLEQAAEKLARTKTGQLEETKAYLATALNSLGLVDDAKLLEQATGVQELRKVFSQILFSGGIKDKIGSQIAAKELEMFAAGFGDVNLEPAVNRFIVGTMRGILDMDAQRSRDWIAFVRSPENRNKTFSRSEIVDWEIQWNDTNPASQFVEQSIANTPVMGEIDWSSPESRNKVKEGYKYVLPDGSIGTYTGSGFDVEG